MTDFTIGTSRLDATVTVMHAACQTLIHGRPDDNRTLTSDTLATLIAAHRCPVACERCRDTGRVPDWTNWNTEYGEPRPKPCPDCGGLCPECRHGAGIHSVVAARRGCWASGCACTLSQPDWLPADVVRSITCRLPIEDLELRVRTYNALHRAGVRTIGQVLEFTEEHMRGLDGVGPTAVKDVQARLRDGFGMALADGQGPDHA